MVMPLMELIELMEWSMLGEVQNMKTERKERIRDYQGTQGPRPRSKTPRTSIFAGQQNLPV
jgi:hypothetical protein